MSAAAPKKVAKKTSASPATEVPAVAVAPVATPAAAAPKKVAMKTSTPASDAAAAPVAAPVATPAPAAHLRAQVGPGRRLRVEQRHALDTHEDDVLGCGTAGRAGGRARGKGERRAARKG